MMLMRTARRLRFLPLRALKDCGLLDELELG